MGETGVQASECCPCSVTKPCLTRCDPIDCSEPASSVLCSLQSLLRFTSIELVMPSDHLMLPARSTVSKFPPPSHQTLLSCWLQPRSSSRNRSFLSSFQPSEPQSDPCKVLSSVSRCHPHNGSPTGFLGKRKSSWDQINVANSASCFSSLEILLSGFFKKSLTLFTPIIVISLL